MGALDFRQFQYAFAQYLRDPRGTPRPAGVSARRAGVYAELLFNNVSGFLDSCLPVCRRVLGEARWRRLQRRFWRAGGLLSPLHRDIPREFVRWLKAGEAPDLPRWLPDLAHYEWVELAVDLMDVTSPPHRADGDLLHAPVVVNPAHMNLRYDWPVQRIGPAYRPRQPQATHLLVWRDARDAVQFMQLNAVSARMLALLAATPTTGEAACRAIAAELQHPAPDQLMAHGALLLAQWRTQGILLGTRT